MRKSGELTDFTRLRFSNGWGINIVPTSSNTEDSWDVTVTYNDVPHYDNDIALGNVLTGQLDDDVAEICDRLASLKHAPKAEDRVDANEN